VKRLVQLLVFATAVSFVLLMAVSASGSRTKSAAAIPDFTPAQLSAPSGANWISENGNIQSCSWRYSTLSQINASNGGSLKLAWTTHLASPTTPEDNATGNANPIVYNGAMYVQDGWTRITAIDGASGKTLWQFDPAVGLNVPSNDTNNNRSVGMGDGMIFTGMYGNVYAINARTGAQVWATQVVNPIGGGGIDVAPVYYKGVVIIGTTGGDWGGACEAVALSAPDGKPYVISTTPFPTYTDQQYVVVAPTAGGGVEWPDPSWDPQTGLEIVCANVQEAGYESPPAVDQHPVVSNAGSIVQFRSSSAPGSLSIARLVAFDPTVNKIVWKNDELSTGGIASGNATPCASPVTTTASGLALIGRIVATPQYPNGVGMVQAFDAKTGAFAWQFPVLVNGQAVATVPRITPYSVGGKEYIVSFTNFSTAGPDISAYTLP
jgi:outer membrane protein assembly factor BamB